MKLLRVCTLDLFIGENNDISFNHRNIKYLFLVHRKICKMKNWLLVLMMLPLIFPIGPIMEPKKFKPVVYWGDIINTFEVKQPLKPIGLIIGGVTLCTDNGVWGFYVRGLIMW